MLIFPRAFDAVLFDLDDTLLDGAAAWAVGLARLFERCPGLDPDEAREAWRAADDEYYPRYLSGELTFDEQRAARMRAWADRTGVNVPAGDEMEWFSHYRAGYVAGWAAFADVAPCLAALPPGTKRGIITNGESDQQRAKLEALGLTGAFPVFVASADIGIAKPDPVIFQHAAGLLGVAPERCAYIGDKRDTDARGASSAGMTGIWLNREGAPAPDDEVAEISTLAELAPLIKA